MNHKIAIILPAYNEEQTIKESILSFHNELPNARIVIINNNSKDQTEKIAMNILSENNIDGLVLNEKRQGKGNAIRRAFKEIDADVYVMSDADMTYPASQVHALIKPILEENIDMCVGDRISFGHYKKENKRPLHNFGNALVQTLVNKLFKSNIVDIMSGYRSFSKRFVKNYPILVEGFELETDMTLHALDKRFNIKEINITYKDRPDGSFSKLDTFNDGLKVLVTIFKIFRYFKPFVFFGLISLFFMILSLVVAIPVFSDWVLYKYIYHLPLAILATGLSIFGVIFFMIGILLDSIVYQNRLEFEQRLIEFETIN